MKTEGVIAEVIKKITPLDSAAMAIARERLDGILKPLDGLGDLEGHLVRVAGITGNARIDLSGKAVVVFCADHGVVARGVSQTGREVTSLVAENLAAGRTSVCLMARVAGAQVVAVDIGISSPRPIPGLWNHRIAPGTRDFLEAPAMSREEAEQALEAGIIVARKLAGQGFRMLATGEMGIGNTTSAAALIAAMTGLPASEVTGRGAGLSDEGLIRKIAVVEEALRIHRPDPEDAIDLLSKVGGFDIAGIAGLCLGGAATRIPVVLDGFVSGVAAMLAARICPGVRRYLLPSHQAAEPAAGVALRDLELEPLLTLRMKLGEGTGAVAALPLYDMASCVYSEAIFFGERGMPPYVRYETAVEEPV
ncbi:MAG: nicotinate-nucleotide--dimethylbenzimidazole phosphoribosyltransferase [Oscillospiraceae bacterium]|jgi:nicotinate-nucleotide--dimethylbenzimidazole phosphoribosyltransferase|nr:nicotinate-nucleotide--dimethylbenzimidazole phosphoribosyltransferase [Oscillospiraceae bacterium]